MTEEEVLQLWTQITNLVMDDHTVGPAFGAPLALAVPRGVGAGVLYLAVQHDFTLKLLENNLRPAIMTAISSLPAAKDIENFVVIVDADVLPSINLTQSVDQSETPNTTKLSPNHRTTATLSEYVRPFNSSLVTPNTTDHLASRLNPKYHFDAFVVGQSNRFAHAAAIAVSETPARAYNPLFIYGGSGLGKTHLLHAVGHYARELYPHSQVRYVSSEDFTNDFINSIANNKGSEFQIRYRSVDVLLVDDIQFLEGKAETQEAFFHTFNTLHSHNKQVVITSDVQPKQLRGFEERMLSRFESGLLTDIQVPDLETRMAILRKKAHHEEIELDPQVLEFIASKFTSNIRELEGALIRVTAYASLNQQRINLSLTQLVLKDLITVNEECEILPTDIISHTANYYDLALDDLYGPSRAQKIAMARQIAMYLCRELTSLSLPKIGQLFGGRDHTTVMYAHKKVSKTIAEKRSVFNQVAELTSLIRQPGR